MNSICFVFLNDVFRRCQSQDSSSSVQASTYSICHSTHTDDGRNRIELDRRALTRWFPSVTVNMWRSFKWLITCSPLLTRVSLSPSHVLTFLQRLLCLLPLCLWSSPCHPDICCLRSLVFCFLPLTVLTLIISDWLSVNALLLSWPSTFLTLRQFVFPADTLPSDPLQSQYDSWLSLVDHLNIKAFVNLTLADSVRHGVQHLLFISGLGQEVFSSQLIFLLFLINHCWWTHVGLLRIQMGSAEAV